MQGRGKEVRGWGGRGRVDCWMLCALHNIRLANGETIQFESIRRDHMIPMGDIVAWHVAGLVVFFQRKLLIKEAYKKRQRFVRDAMKKYKKQTQFLKEKMIRYKNNNTRLCNRKKKKNSTTKNTKFVI